jgi:serine/threonine protein phosphatase 1
MRSAPERGTKRAGPIGKFACLRSARRVWAIAAIHGEAVRLSRLHDRISEKFEDGDRVVYLGNYVGNGEAVLATVDELLDFRRRVLGRERGFACDVVFLRGAQEEMWQKLLQLQFAPNPTEVLKWMVGAGMEATVRAYGSDPRQGFAASRGGPRAITRWTGTLRDAMNARPGHTMLFSALRHAAFTAEHTLLFAHASVDPSRPLTAQGDAFWWGNRDVLGLTTAFDGFRRIIVGNDRHRRGVLEGSFAVSLGGGTGHGGPLIAACFGLDGAVLELVEV